MATFSIAVIMSLSACHSSRQHVESIALTQRRQQLLCNDTVWKKLQLQLHDVTVDWPADSLAPTQMRVAKAELGWQSYAASQQQSQMMESDSVTYQAEETHETTSCTSRASPKPCLLRMVDTICTILVFTGLLYILYIAYKKHHKKL